MQIIKAQLPGVVILEPRRLGDARGFFVETFQAERYAAAGIVGPFVQDNLSRSDHGVLRGLHLQNPKPQGKLVSALRGCVLDVCVDVRLGSPTFGQHLAVELSEENGRQVYVPRGFAHGFAVLSESADVFYKCDSFYSPQDEIAIRWNDPSLAIDWRLLAPKLSKRDEAALPLRQVSRLPRYER